MTMSVGISDVLPGMDFDISAGGMFKETDQFASTIASVESYWVGLGMTWRFGRVRPDAALGNSGTLGSPRPHRYGLSGDC